MRAEGVLDTATQGACADEEVVARVLAGDTASYEIIMRRYNQRLFRVALAIVRDRAEAEDVMQEAYVRAYQHLGQFARRAPFAAWLTRIAVHEALSRVLLRGRELPLEDSGEDGEVSINKAVETAPDPEQNAARAELGRLLESVILALPAHYRTVIMLRDVEGLSISEVAAALDLSEQNVKVRLHRGRAMARAGIVEQVGSSARDAFPFMGMHCDRMVQAVLTRLASLAQSTPVH
jgi:RNA polymerase sigma-70 factor (ECF subfamily)